MQTEPSPTSTTPSTASFAPSAPETRGEVINLGGTETLTVLELAERIQGELFGQARGPLQVRFVPYESLPGKYQDVRHRVPDTSKARRLLGFEAQVSLEDGLRRTVAWHRDVRDSGLAAAEA